MKYQFDWLNESEKIEVKEIISEDVNVLLIDEDGAKYLIPLKIKDLNINEKVLKELEKYKV